MNEDYPTTKEKLDKLVGNRVHISSRFMTIHGELEYIEPSYHVVINDGSCIFYHSDVLAIIEDQIFMV